ncbi:MAG TPA: AAA family ATPase [Trebonia sp.]|jgi:predicted ATPase
MTADGRASWLNDRRAYRAIRPAPASALAPDQAGTWPASVPAVRHILENGLDLPKGITLLVGENGSGKSTLVELIAEACGLNPMGGSRNASLFRTREGQDGPGLHLTVERGLTRPAWSFFLRADTMHSLYGYLEDVWGRSGEGRLHHLSHGEGFLEVLRTRVREPGFYLMDEPDAPLSFTSTLGLAALLHDLAEEGAQVIVATHSPILAALPGATLLELGEWGIRPSGWEDLELVASWRQFMASPQSFLRHMFTS